MKVKSDTLFEKFNVSGQELRVHWNIVEQVNEDEVVEYEAEEALCLALDSREVIIEKIIASKYSLSNELATINNQLEKPEQYAAYQEHRALAKQLATEYVNTR